MKALKKLGQLIKSKFSKKPVEQKKRKSQYKITTEPTGRVFFNRGLIPPKK